MKKQIILLITMLLSVYAFGQQKLEPLEVGDKIPNLKFKNVLNHPTGEILISDYKGKLLILDFWATWCAPCVASFPKLDSLDKAFGDELAILPVTYQDKEEVEKLFSRMAKLKEIKKPMVYGDNMLRELFPHQTLPHYVWIDKNGTVLAITGIEDLNEENINNALDGVSYLGVQKQEKIVAFDNNESLFFSEQFPEGQFTQFHAALSGYVEGWPSMLSIKEAVNPDPNKDHLRIYFSNVPLIKLFKSAYSEGRLNLMPNRIILETSNPEPLLSRWEGTSREYLAWLKSGNGYSFELKVPITIKDDVWGIFKAQLEALFPQYEAQLEFRNQKCLALTVIDESMLTKSLEGDPSVKVDFFGASLKNSHLSWLVGHLNSKYLQHLDTPIIDLTKTDYPVDMTIEASLGSVESIRDALNKQGLDLQEVESKIEVLVIRDRE
ncbi:TlpA family protein disulfide reductase [Belliella sp. DSM 111904]|uniref:TlpA family protein disulfide reductase n=1 Tax=Belliella filtrata TaxID=2923435 RepID=A0ABS9V0V6_9BACT|nr:TlpA family protein disulfide reductase [Belliella filtrata]MCH7409984.1 TlpA family protein disulfide reductase [Belliella filtrata]